MIGRLTDSQSAVMARKAWRIRGAVVHARGGGKTARTVAGVAGAVGRDVIGGAATRQYAIVALHARARRAFEYLVDVAQLAVNLPVLALQRETRGMMVKTVAQAEALRWVAGRFARVADFFVRVPS